MLGMKCHRIDLIVSGAKVEVSRWRRARSMHQVLLPCGESKPGREWVAAFLVVAVVVVALRIVLFRPARFQRTPKFVASDCILPLVDSTVFPVIPARGRCAAQQWMPGSDGRAHPWCIVPKGRTLSASGPISGRFNAPIILQVHSGGK